MLHINGDVDDVAQIHLKRFIPSFPISALVLPAIFPPIVAKEEKHMKLEECGMIKSPNEKYEAEQPLFSPFLLLNGYGYNGEDVTRDLSPVVNGSIIVRVAELLTRETMMTVDYCSEGGSCCGICLKHKINIIATNLMVEKRENENAKSNLADAVLMDKSLSYILKVLQDRIHLRQCEVVQGLYLYHKIIQMHWMCTTFRKLLKNNLDLVFVVCLIISHKNSSDGAYKNSQIAQLFNLHVSSVNEMERILLALLDYDISSTISLLTYNTYAAAIGAECLVDANI